MLLVSSPYASTDAGQVPHLPLARPGQPHRDGKKLPRKAPRKPEPPTKGGRKPHDPANEWVIGPYGDLMSKEDLDRLLSRQSD